MVRWVSDKTWSRSKAKLPKNVEIVRRKKRKRWAKPGQVAMLLTPPSKGTLRLKGNP